MSVPSVVDSITELVLSTKAPNVVVKFATFPISNYSLKVILLQEEK